MAAAPELRQHPSSPADHDHQLITVGQVLSLPEPLEHREVLSERSPWSEVEEDVDGGGDECRTPTSKESRIPLMVTAGRCPPAPQKRRRVEVPGKRRVSALELFRVGPELLCQVFRPLEPGNISANCLPSSPTRKKRKRCCMP